MKITIDTRTRTINIDTGVFHTENMTKEQFSEDKVNRRPNGEFAPKGAGGGSKLDLAADGTELNTVDISASFKKVKCDPNHQQECMERYLGSLFGQIMATSTKPLKIRFGKDELGHIVGTNVPLDKYQRRRHNAALLELNKIIGACKRINRAGDVDLGHNTRKQTLERKKSVSRYIYFKARLKADKNLFYTIELSTERAKNGDPNILTLYHVRVKGTK